MNEGRRRPPDYWLLGYSAEGDDRMRRIFDRPMLTLKAVRCGHKEGTRTCGRVLGEIRKTTEGLLWVGFSTREGKPRYWPTFLVDLDADPDLRCQRHRKRPVTASAIKDWAETKEPGDLFV